MFNESLQVTFKGHLLKRETDTCITRGTCRIKGARVRVKGALIRGKKGALIRRERSIYNTEKEKGTFLGVQGGTYHIRIG